jgi:cytoskeletal protein CcmA (bactofilin family)
MGLRTRTIAAQVANSFSNATNTQTLTPTANVTFESLTSNTLSVTTITSSGLTTSLNTAYSNAIAYSGNAALAYANAVAYAAANTYVNTQLGLKASLSGATFSGAVSGITTFAAGNTTITGTANVTANLTANNVRTYGSVQIDGDLTVSGNAVTVNVTNLAVEDNMIYLNSGSVVTHPDLGFAGNYNDGNYRHAGVFRDATDARWKFFDGYQPEPDASAFIDTSNTTFRIADIPANTLYVANGVFTSGVSGITTLAAGNTTIAGFANVTSNIQGGGSLTIAGAASGITTLAAGNTTITGDLRVTGNITAYYSDARLKDFQGKIENALGKIHQLNGYYFVENEVAKSLGYINDKLQVGVSAQETKEVLPEIISAAPIDDQYMTVSYEKFAPLFIEAIKELDNKYQSHINVLEDRIKPLEGK